MTWSILVRQDTFSWSSLSARDFSRSRACTMPSSSTSRLFTCKREQTVLKVVFVLFLNMQMLVCKIIHIVCLLLVFYACYPQQIWQIWHGMQYQMLLFSFLGIRTNFYLPDISIENTKNTVSGKSPHLGSFLHNHTEMDVTQKPSFFAKIHKNIVFVH
jgi:uncharacterized membrane protein YjgN (DUF898 family)